jgi:hypothetical protein
MVKVRYAISPRKIHPICHKRYPFHELTLKNGSLEKKKPRLLYFFVAPKIKPPTYRFHDPLRA